MLRRLSIVLGYTLATAVVVGGTVLLIAYGNGYSYDFKAGRLVHRGLVLLDSNPGGAKITLNGKLLKQKTPFRETYEAGQYAFTVAKDGYRTWNQTVKVTAAKVNLVQYIILLPQHFQVDSVGNYPAISQSLASRDRRKMAFVVPTGDAPGVWLMDTGSRNRTKIYTPATPAEGTPVEKDELLSWADDASHVLVKRTIGDTVAFLVVSTNPSDAVINLTDTFKLNFPSLTFNPSDWHELYWVDAGGLQRLDVGNQEVTPVLATHVGAYTFAGDRVIYVDTTLQPASLWSLDHSGRKTELESKLPVSASYELSYATYIGRSQVMVAAPDSHQAALYSDIYGDHATTTLIPSDATHALFNSDGRFSLLWNDKQVQSYDLEHATLNTFAGNNAGVTGLSWFDTYHVQFNRSGDIILSEFDGNYATSITRGDSLAPTNSSDNKYIFATSPTSTGATQIKALKIRY